MPALALLVRLALVVAAVVALWGAGAGALLRQAAGREEARVEEVVAAARAAFDEEAQALAREAAMLARDGAVVDGAARGDLAALTRSTSPRMLTLTLERVADVLLLSDGGGGTLLQVPALPPVAIPGLVSPAAPTAVVRELDGHAWLLGLAPVRGQDDRSVGVVVAGRRLEQLERRLAHAGGRPAIVALAGDRLLDATRAGVPAAGWLEAARAGAVQIGGAMWALRPLGGHEALWVAVPTDLAPRRQLWLGLVAALVVMVAAVVAAAWIATRPRRPTGQLAMRRELEALYTAARTMAGGADVRTTAAELLTAACGVARAEAGAVYRLDGDVLTPVAHRGLTPAELSQMGARSLPASLAGEAVRAGRPVVTELRRSGLIEPELVEVARAAGRRLQVALPIGADGAPWGVLILLWGARGEPVGEELRLLEAVAQQIGLAVVRASLEAIAREKSRRLEALTRLGRTLAATLSLDDLLQRVADAAVEVFGASEAGVWLVDDGAGTVSLGAQSPAAAAGAQRLSAGEALAGVVVASRTLLIIADLATDPRVLDIDHARFAGLASFAGVPLTLGEHVLGALTIATLEPHASTDEEVALLQSLASHAAAAIESTRRFAAETRHRDQLADLFEINKRFAAAESAEALLGAIALEAARLLEIDNARFWLVEGGDLVLAGLAGTATETVPRHRIRIGESLPGRVVREDRTIVATLGELHDLLPEHRLADPRAGYLQFLGVPLRTEERIVGVLTFRARRPFTARHRGLAETFAGQAALALERARLYREASRQVERMTALADVERLLTETLDPDVVAQRIADGLPLLVRAHWAGVYRLEAESGDLVGVSVSGAAPWSPRLPAGDGAVGLAVREGRPIVTTDILSDPRITLTPESRAVAEAALHHAVLAMPLVIRDRMIGGISVAHGEEHAFDEEDVRIVQTFANRAAVALENARLFGEAARQAERMAALADVERLLSEALDPNVVAQRIVDSVCSLLGARSAALYGVEAESGALVAVTVSRDVGATFHWTPRLPPGHGLVGLAVAERCPAVAADVLADPRLRYGDEARAAIAAATHRSMVAVPLLVGDRVLGALAVGDVTGRGFAPEELRLARGFADQAALVLENARLFSLETARRSQIEALAAVERELAAELDRERLLHLIIDRASRLFSGFGSIYLLEDGARLVRAACSGSPVGDGQLPVGAGVSGASAAERRGLLVNDYARSPHALAAFKAVGTNRAMAQPLVARDRVLGVVTMSRRGADAPPFSADDLAVLESFANQTAIVLENARLHDEARRGRDEAHELARVAGVLTESLEVSAVGARVVDSVLTLLSAQSAGLRLLAPDGRLMVVAWRGPESARFEIGHGQPGDAGLAGRAIAEARAVWSADVHADANLGVPDDIRDRLTRYGHRAVLAVPLFAKGRTIGVLIVADAGPRVFSEAEVALARGFADQAALALDNARLHEEAELRRHEAQFLADLARTINSSLDLGLVLQRITEGAQELCTSDLARIALREPGTERFVYRHWIGARYDGYDGFRIQPGDGASGIVIATGRPFRSDDQESDPRITRVSAEVVRAEGMVTGLTVPIRIDERVDGLLSVHNRTERPFTDRDEAILVQLADHAAIAIRNASLYESVETRAARLRTLADVNRVVSSSLDTVEVLHAIARAASELMDRAFVAFWVADETARTLTFSVVSDPTVAADPPITTLAFGEGVAGQAAAERRTIDVPDVAASDRFRTVAWARAHGIVGFRAVPIMLQGALLGVLALGVGHPLRVDADDEALLDSFVAQAAVALDHARLYAETRRRLEETGALLTVAEILNSTLDPRQLLERAAVKIAQVCGVSRCTLELWDGDRVTPLVSQFADGHRDEAMWQAFLSVRPYSPRAAPAQARALETRRPVVIEDATASDQLPREWIETFGPKSYMVVPLIRQDQVMGLLTLDYTERVTPFQDWQVSRATAIAGQLALALANARLYAEAQERLRETSTLLAVGEALSRPAPLEEGMRALAREVARATGAD
ncbi:MAG TPA: GAF domain-containing protein, partial [Methylomirabilota bacterium]|nr:GAF domain-containing protein [Methylomirabilota bacterium]